MLWGVHYSCRVAQEQVVGLLQIAQHGSHETLGEDAVGDGGAVGEVAPLVELIGRTEKLALLFEVANVVIAYSLPVDFTLRGDGGTN